MSHVINTVCVLFGMIIGIIGFDRSTDYTSVLEANKVCLNNGGVKTITYGATTYMNVQCTNSAKFKLKELK